MKGEVVSVYFSESCAVRNEKKGSTISNIKPVFLLNLIAKNYKLFNRYKIQETFDNVHFFNFNFNWIS